MRLAIKLSLCLFPLLASGASDEFRFYDFSACQVFRLSTEPSPDRAYQKMLTEAGTWNVYEFSGPSGGGRGFCKWSGPSYKHGARTRFLCNQDYRSYFPLAGATYSVIRDRGGLPSYRCVKGCKKDTPGLIHYVDEELDSQRNIEHEKTLRKFHEQCQEGE